MILTPVSICRIHHKLGRLMEVIQYLCGDIASSLPLRYDRTQL